MARKKQKYLDLDEVFEQTLIRPPWEYLNNMRDTNSYLEKGRILQQAIDEKNWPFLEGLKRVLDPFIRGDSVDATYKESEYAHGYTWSQLKKLVDRIIQGKIRGIVKETEIEIAKEDSDKEVWNNWYRYIINKRLYANISYKRYNEIIKANGLDEYVINSFIPQTSREFEERKFATIGDRIIDYITPGRRLIVLADPNSTAVAMYSNGKVVSDLYQNTVVEYTEFAHSFLKESMIFDGDVMSESLHELKDRGYFLRDVRLDDAVHIVYDLIPYKEYMERYFEQTLDDRRSYLEKIVSVAHSSNFLPNTQVLPHIRLDLNHETGQNMDKLYDYIKTGLDYGYKGVIIKDPSKPYKCCRTNGWISYRHKYSVVLRIDDVTQNQKYVTVHCSGYDNDRFFKVGVTRGMSLKTMEYCINNVDSIRGKHIEVQGSEITPPQANKTPQHFTLKLPSVVKFRTDLDELYDN